MGFTAIIILAVIWVGIFALGGRWMGSLRSDWKTLSTGSRNVFGLGGLWKISMFYGLGTRRQEYLDLVAERMGRKSFKRVEEIKRDMGGQYLYIEGSDLIFESPEGEYQTGIRAVSIGENLQVGFNHMGTLKIAKKAVLMFACGFIFALFVSLLSCDIVKYTFPSVDLTQLAMLWMIIFFPLMFGPIFFIAGKKKRTLDRQIEQFLVETAESMGSKQITSFRRIWVKY